MQVGALGTLKAKPLVVVCTLNGNIILKPFLLQRLKRMSILVIKVLALVVVIVVRLVYKV